MKKRIELSKRDSIRINGAVDYFLQRRHFFEILAKSLVGHLIGHPKLSQLIHFIKWRVKDEQSLRRKLEIKTLTEKQKPSHAEKNFINEENLFDVVVDLAGVRVLHLHTEQMRSIHNLILDVVNEHKYQIVGKPTAHCWDIEYEQLFEQIGIETESHGSMYTTVHYDILANQRTRITCELQVRSLMDEVWSEVSHRVNYPQESRSEACRDQLKVLARLTTGGTRLVDSIFKSHRESIVSNN